MYIKMFYFSGTGNTKLVTEKIEKAYIKKNEVELIEIEKVLNEKMLLDFDSDILLGLGFPVYDLLPPEIVNSFIDLLPNQQDPSPIFLYSTMAFIKGDCLNIVAKKLKEKGYYAIEKTGFRCPSNGVVTYEQTTHSRYRNVRFEKNIDKLILDYTKKTMDAYYHFKNKPKANVGGIYPHYNIIRFFSEKIYGEKYYLDLCINEDCNNCGSCIKACPVQNITKKNNKTTVINDNGCLRCLRCVSRCPKSAITFTSSKLVKRYTPQLIDELYKQACKNI